MRTLVVITAYNRLTNLVRLVDKLHSEDKTTDFVVFDDHSTEQFKPMSDRIKVFSALEHLGKAGFWRTYNNIFAYCEEYKYDYYIILPDDVDPCPNFVAKCIEAYESIPGCTCLSPLLTNRSVSDGISRWGQKPIIPKDTYYITNYFDCCGIMKRDFFEALDWHMEPIEPSSNPHKSSGVGQQITLRLQAQGKKMCHVKRTLLSTTNDESEMNKEERKRTPMRADYHDNANCVDMYMASLWRGGHVIETAKSLLRQPELNLLTICCNNYTDEQWDKVCAELPKDKVLLCRTNNEKGSNEKMRYIWTTEAKYIAMADDDLIYPEDYLFKMIHGCNIHNAAVSLHGGVFKSFPMTKYYGGRTMLSWNRTLEQDVQVDVIGNGFGLFKREWFTEEQLKAIYEEAPEVSMDDIILSCKFKEMGIPMFVLAHKADCATHKEIQQTDSYVFDRYKDNDSFQVQYINSHVDPATLAPKLPGAGPQPLIVRIYQKKYPKAKVYLQDGFLCIEYNGAVKRYKV